ncbi:histidine triad nucleotide-binding protein [bacterium]|nr:histidine triad nucleotide-binding protein [bacterium]
MKKCIFCKIAQHQISTNIVYEDPDVIAFHDIAPQAPVHILIISKKHVRTPNDFEDTDAALIGKLILTGQKLAKQFGCAETGYRLVMNCNKDGGQSEFHVHVHLLGKRKMLWPPG